MKKTYVLPNAVFEKIYGVDILTDSLTNLGYVNAECDFDVWNQKS